MNKRQQSQWTRGLALTTALTLLAAAGLGGCVGESSPAAFLTEGANAYRGGRLWDKWWHVPDVKEGIEPGATVKVGDEDVKSSLPTDNPLYATNTAGNKRAGSQTWRCKECHGWDYKGVDGAYGKGSHKTGFAGVWGARDKSAAELFNAIAKGTGVSGGAEGHAFGKVLKDTDIADLVKFIREGTIDTGLVVSADKLPVGDKDSGKKLYTDHCGKCHGSGGDKLNFVSGSYASEYLYDIAMGNPWEFTHKVRFGQPKGDMPDGAAKAYLLKDVADILAYAQTLSVPGLAEASRTRGGVLWDKWWKVNDVAEPTKTNPLYEDKKYNTLGGKKSGATTWRCKECHGWDYKGVDGVYANGSHATGIKGVWGAVDYDAAKLKAIIGEGKLPDGTVLKGHDFGTAKLLSSHDVADLALFIKHGLVDPSPYVSAPTKTSKGNAALGSGLYNGNCATCHGKDGLRVNFGHDDPGETEYVADVARDNPWELTHKIRWGQPGSAKESEEMEEDLGIKTGHMPNSLDAGYDDKAIAAIVAYCQTLPGAAERGGQAWDKWWQVSGVKQPITPGGAVTDKDGKVTKSSLATTNPQYVGNPAGSKRSGADTWRCKECHGWDYKGAAGAYAKGSHRTGFAGVWGAKNKADKDIRDAIFAGKLSSGTVAAHAFGPVIGDAVIRDLVHFIKHLPDWNTEVVDPATKGVREKYVKLPAGATGTQMVERSRDANMLLGLAKFENDCAGCHGSDGRKINFKESKGGLEYPGSIARDNPWELLNKIAHGQAQSTPTMPTAIGKGYTMDDMADLLLYIRTLPDK